MNRRTARRLLALPGEAFESEWCRRGLRVAIAEKAVGLATNPRERVKWSRELRCASRKLALVQEAGAMRSPRQCADGCGQTLPAGAHRLALYTPECRQRTSRESNNRHSRESKQRRRARVTPPTDGKAGKP